MPSPARTNTIAARKRSRVIEVTANRTLTAGESGSVVVLNLAASLTVTLPKAQAGIEFTFVSKLAPTSGAGYAISPNAADKINYISGVTNKDIINTQATAALGDLVRLVGINSTEWQVAGVIGTWAKEA